MKNFGPFFGALYLFSVKTFFGCKNPIKIAKKLFLTLKIFRKFQNKNVHDAYTFSLCKRSRGFSRGITQVVFTI